MKISTEELGEVLIAIGTVLKNVSASTDSPTTEPEPVVVDLPQPTELGSFEPMQEEVTITPPQQPQGSPLDAAAQRIQELEAELNKMKANSAVLGLQPIKLNNATINTEVNKG